MSPAFLVDTLALILNAGPFAPTRAYQKIAPLHVSTTLQARVISTKFPFRTPVSSCSLLEPDVDVLTTCMPEGLGGVCSISACGRTNLPSP